MACRELSAYTICLAINYFLLGTFIVILYGQKCAALTFLLFDSLPTTRSYKGRICINVSPLNSKLLPKFWIVRTNTIVSTLRSRVTDLFCKLLIRLRFERGLPVDRNLQWSCRRVPDNHDEPL